MYFILYACCKIVTGHQQCLIYDLQRCRYLPIPTELTNLFSNNTINLSLFAEEEFDAVMTFCENMVANDFGFFYDRPEEFIPLSLDYETPSTIKNAVITLAPDRDYHSIYAQLETLGCETVTWVIQEELAPTVVSEQTQLAEKYGFIFTEIILLFDVTKAWLDTLFHLVQTHALLKRVIGYYNNQQPAEDFGPVAFDVYFKKRKGGEKFDPRDEFAVNFPFFIEAQHHNIYYNQKVFIDEQGNANGQPTIAEAITPASFQQLWKVCKDKVDICKACEYRYMCNDPRVPIQRANDAYYYETECCYNPYLAKWEHEEGYQTLAECGITCNHEQFAIAKAPLLAATNI